MEKGLIIKLPAVVVRREIAQHPAVLQALDLIEKSVFLASIEKTFEEYPGRDLMIELAKALRFIAKDVGYKGNDDFDYLCFRVCEVLKKYYRTLTIKDFHLAFEMSLTGELDEYLPKNGNGQPDRGHYQQFNIEYICKILNAYKLHRARILKKAADALPSPQQVRDPEREKEYRNRMKSDLVQAFYDYRNGNIVQFSPIQEMLFQQYLGEIGKMEKVEVTEEEQGEILRRTISSLLRNGMNYDANRLKNEGLQAGEIQYDALALARRKAILKAFDAMIQNNDDLGELINYE